MRILPPGFLLSVALALLSSGVPAAAETVELWQITRSSLIFREDATHHLKVTLRVAATDLHKTISWVSTSASLEPEVLDPAGKPLPEAAPAQPSSTEAVNYLMPPGSAIECRLSDPAPAAQVETSATPAGHYRLLIAGHLWFIPIDQAAKHSLHLRVHGSAWDSTIRFHGGLKLPLLFDFPATPLKVDSPP